MEDGRTKRFNHRFNGALSILWKHADASSPTKPVILGSRRAASCTPTFNILFRRPQLCSTSFITVRLLGSHWRRACQLAAARSYCSLGSSAGLGVACRFIRRESAFVPFHTYLNETMRTEASQFDAIHLDSTPLTHTIVPFEFTTVQWQTDVYGLETSCQQRFIQC